jgi:ABC-type transport system substrate-binding protein
MKGRFASTLAIVVILSLLASTVLAGCATQEAEEPTQQVKATEIKATEPPAVAQVVNSLGIELPADAAPIEEQVIRIPSTEETWLTWDASVYDVNSGSYEGWGDSCVRPDKDYNPQPAGCESWEVSDDGLTWTFHLPKDKIWSDDTPVTAEDWVFTLLHYARPDYDFEWFYSMANIVNWKKVSRGELPPEELGAKVVDDYTFTVTTTQPTPYLIKIFADLWLVPKHIVKDWQNDGSWAFDENNWISCNSFIIDAWDKGKQLVFVANKKYTGPYPPMVEKVTYIFIEPETRWTAYKNDELDYIGGGYEQDLPPSAMAEIMANPELNKQLIAWPNFITYYLFLDTWNPPFDDLQVRQAFSHAINRDAIIEGPLKYQAVPAYSMNPPGFPGESVEELESVQNYDPELAAELLAEAGYAGGEGFPKLTMNLRNAFPALINAAEAIAAMLKENLGVDVEIQDLEYSIFTEGYRNQKKNKGGDFIFALVPYEFDFVDGSNLLSVWGGCEEEGETDLSNMPGRHTWYNKEYNDLNCQAGAILGDEAKRNELYRKAERILIEDVAMVPIYHAILSAMVKPDIAGPMFEPDSKGMVTWHRFRFTSREALIYRAKSE